MEAVPRMPMLSFELKQSPEFVEFGPSLKQYIREHYGEDPALYNKSCNELEQLRQSAVHVSHDFMGCSILKKYYAQLQFLQGRFPMTELGEAAMPFTWEDVYSGREITHNDIKFEQACILYNIGCLHSLLGALDTRQSADGMKVSCTHFQCAAWAYEHLRDHYGSSAMSLDMSHELLTFQSNLMLAQAQECILEKSMADSRKSSITAKVSAQIVEFYNTALKSLTVCNTEELISSKQFKDWKKKIDIKVLFYTCITNFYMGQQGQEQQKWGQSLAYYTSSLNKLEECEKLAKNESSDVQESLRFTHDVVGGKHQATKKDNDFVYHEKVPDKESLPEVKGAPLVKGIPFNANDPDISGPDIFIKLVPMSAHEASSLYSEEKATLLRRIASEIAEKDDELNQYLSSLQLDQTELNPEPERLPQQLLEKCAAISVRPNAIKDLVDSMTSVSNVATEVDLGIQEIQQMLQEESKAELEYQDLFGKRAPNIILSEIAKECSKFEEGHKKGSQSNTDLHKAMNTHINNLKLLSSPLEDIQKLLPSVDKERDPESADIIKELTMLMNKVEEMRGQRTTLEQTMRKEIMEDDITGTLAKQEGVNRETVFAEQLKKHEKTSTLIRQNLTAQANILRALTDANAKYANIRRATRDTIVRRDQMIRDLINSYDIYEDLMAKSQKGLEFYKKLEANVQKLLSRCRGVCKVQQEERQQMMARFKPKVPAAAPARPAADKPPVSGPVPGSVVPGPGLPPLSTASVTPMFDGPKLKDYLPFMKPNTFDKKAGFTDLSKADPAVQNYISKTGSQPNSGTASPVHVPITPNTFGKKAGSPDLSKADPAVQNYISKTGSLPNSGTASPVHVPSMSGSVPASPDHVRQGKYNPQLHDLNEAYPSLQDMQGPGQGQLRQQYPVVPGGQVNPEGQQGQMPVNQRTNIPSSRRPSQSPSPRQPAGYPGVSPGPDQSQFGNQPLNMNEQYVPLNEKWKREAQARNRGAEALPPGQGQIINQQGQQVDPRLAAQGYTDPRVPQGLQPAPSMSQHRPGLPDQQTMVYGQQPMVGYREITNTVSTIETPVISPNKDGQGQIDQYGQVVGGHRHLQGTFQSQVGPATHPGQHAAAQQPAGQYANEQYWQQQMQQEQNRLAQSQRNLNQAVLNNQIPPSSQTFQPSGSMQGQPTALQSQGIPPQGQNQGVPSQVQPQSKGYSPQMQVQGPGASSQGQGHFVGTQPHMGSPARQGQYMPPGNIQGQGQNFPNQNVQPQHHMSQVQPHPAVNTSQAGFNQYPQQQTVPGGHQQQPVGPQTSTLPTAGQLAHQAGQTHSGGHGEAPGTQYQVHQPSQTGQQSYPASQTQGMNQNYQMMPTAASMQQPHIPTQPYSNQSNIPQPVNSQALNSVRPPTPLSQGSNPTSVYQQPGQNPNVQNQASQQYVSNQQIPGSQSYQQNYAGHVQTQQQYAAKQAGLQINQTGSPKPQSIPHQSVTPQPAVSGLQLTGQQINMGQGHMQAGQFQQNTQPNVNQHMPTQSPAQLPGLVHQTGAQQSQQGTHAHGNIGQQQQMPQQQPQYQGQNLQNQQGHQFQGHSVPQGSVQQPGQSSHMTGLTGHPQQQQMPQQYQGHNIHTQQGQQVQGQTVPYGGHIAGQQPGQQMISHGQQTQMNVSRQPIQSQQFNQTTSIQGQGGQGPSSYTTQQGQGMTGGSVQGAIQQHQQQQPFSSSGMYPNQNYPQQSQGQTAGNFQGQMGQGQQSQYQGGAPTSRPAIPAPHYSDTAINRQATAQMGQGQTGYVGQSPQPNQGQVFQGQMNQPYPANMGIQNQQPPASSGNISTPVRGQSPSLAPGQMSSQGQMQGQIQGQTLQQGHFQGQQPALQPQILQPTVVHQQNVQDQGQGQMRTSSQGHMRTGSQGQGQIQTSGQGHMRTGSQGQVNVKPERQVSVPSGPAESVTDAGKPMCGYTAVTSEHSQSGRSNTEICRSESQVIPASRQLSTASSLDEILSSSPDNRDRVDVVLAPKVLTAQEIQQQKEDQLKNSNIVVQSKDPYKDRSKLDKFVMEVEKFAKFIEGYEKPSCSGPTPLDSVFKDLMEEQDKAGRKQTLAIARCYPMKNRDQDIMPFDDSRVLISSLKDDYINASWITDVSPSCPKFIATQWPLPVTLVDFWVSVYEQGVEVITALSSDIETGKKFPVYVPEVKGETINHGPVQLTLQSVKQKPFWTERIIHLRHSETKSGRTVVHLHYAAWPVSGYPEKVSYLLQFITEVHSFYRQQRSLLKPIVVHCSNGVGRTGIFLLTYMGMMEVNHGQGIIHVPEVAGKILWKRRNLIHKKDQLKYCYDALLYYAQDVLAKQGILIHKASFGDQLPKPGVKSQSWEPGEDILFGSISFSNLQTNIAKLGTKGETNRLDQRLQMLKSGEKEEEKLDQSKSEMKSSSGTVLPDLVQSSPGRSIENKTLDGIVLEPVNTNPMDKLFDEFDSKLEVIDTQTHVIKNEQKLESSKFSSPNGSSKSSPIHSSHESSTSPQVSKKFDNGVSSTLTDLQDPSTFTIGTGESNKKKKITKADFTGEKTTTEAIDPDDPLSSLDPFWTVKK